MLRAGTNVVTPSFYPLYHPPSTPPALAEPIRAACLDGGSSILASGIDPGWICDILPLFLTGMSADITEIRSREIFNYALYDQPGGSYADRLRWADGSHPAHAARLCAGDGVGSGRSCRR